mmetsp:Transcript_99918/g.278233  ORF Transcript_99918/g.278233 Transcript_99918/m.278233 type:complete len:140 (-) Transcript_99918:720-1139(-)
MRSFTSNVTDGVQPGMLVTSSSTTYCSSSCSGRVAWAGDQLLLEAAAVVPNMLPEIPEEEDPNKPPKVVEDAKMLPELPANKPPVDPEHNPNRPLDDGLREGVDTLPGEKRPRWLDSVEGLENRLSCVPEGAANNGNPA